jgi:hypothetical protein
LPQLHISRRMRRLLAERQLKKQNTPYKRKEDDKLKEQ